MRRRFLLLALLGISACQKADNEPGPGGVTMGEARALDDAAEMLEKRRPPPELVEPAPVEGTQAAVAAPAD